MTFSWLLTAEEQGCWDFMIQLESKQCVLMMPNELQSLMHTSPWETPTHMLTASQWQLSGLEKD